MFINSHIGPSISPSIGPNPNSHIGPSISPSTGPNHNLRFWFQTYVPGFGLGSNSYPNILIPISIFHV